MTLRKEGAVHDHAFEQPVLGALSCFHCVQSDQLEQRALYAHTPTCLVCIRSTNKGFLARPAIASSLFKRASEQDATPGAAISLVRQQSSVNGACIQAYAV